MILVADSSVILAYILQDESSEYADSISDLFKKHGFHVPSHFSLETGNVLLMANRRGRLDMKTLAEAISGLNALDPEVDLQTGELAYKDTLQLALKHTLTLYDAAYLELTIRLKGLFATLDKNLQKAAEAEGVFLKEAT